MSNGSNSPFGFIPYQRGGRSEIPMMEADVIASQDAGAMAEGDAITFDAGATGGIQRAAAGDIIMGVIAGFRNVSGAFIPWAPYVAALTAAKAQFFWLPEQLYVCQGDVTALLLAQRFLVANHVDATPSSTLYKSAQYLNGANLAGTNTLGWKVWDYLRVEDNQIGDTYPRYVVKCNRSFWANQVAGAS